MFGAVFTDLYKDKIYNAWIIPGMAAGLLLSLGQGMDGVINTLCSMGISLLILLPVYFIKGIAAGDVKLFLATASFLSMQDLMSCILLSFLLAGAISLVIIIIKKKGQKTIHFAIPVMMSVLFMMGGII